MTRATPISVYEAIRDAYLRYYDTAFWLRDETLRTERRALLERPGVIFTDPLLEPVLPHDPSASIAEACGELGLDAGIGDRLGSMLFNSDGSFRLREHQLTALRTALRENVIERNVVVTSGTGSGKTESFLLPIFARLLRESSQWRPDPPLHRWWDSHEERNAWQPARANSRRPAAVRALILYPTNALVEDQITRLRRAVTKARESGPGDVPLLYFGRYTGATRRRCAEEEQRRAAT